MTLSIKFDYIIGNPPYISYRDLDEATRIFVKGKFKSCAYGKFDYSYAFIEASLEGLSDNGAFGEIILVLEPILNQKKIKVKLTHDGNAVTKRIFVSDFESIIYNLIINSIESFEKGKITERIIDISLEVNGDFVLHYKDSGNGLGDLFKDPYDIFKYGTTSKRDGNGEVFGTGLGMYIVASTAREYNAKYELVEYKTSFALDLIFPI